MTTIWDKNGFIRIPVEQRHIDQSMERNSSHCMTGEAIRSAIPDATHIPLDPKGPALLLSDTAHLPGQHHRL